MHVIRDEQKKLLKTEEFEARLPELVPKIIRRLGEVGILERGLPDEPEKQLYKTTVADMRRAQRSQISSLNGMLQYCSYRYTLGDGWRDDPAVQAVLEDPVKSGREKLLAIEALLPDY